MPIDDLKRFADEQGIFMPHQQQIVEEAVDVLAKRYEYGIEAIKQNFDTLIYETEKEAYGIYLMYEQQYGARLLTAFSDMLIYQHSVSDPQHLSRVMGEHFQTLDRFYLSLSQSRRVRAGSTFEYIHNALFKQLYYPFDSQKVINGKPDFLLPSYDHYRINPMDCIIFTAKRTLRERWRQIVTEGTRGLGFFLATIDEKVSSVQLGEMLRNRIYLVCPTQIKELHYPEAKNVISFGTFFRDFLDPAMDRWERNGIIQTR